MIYLEDEAMGVTVEETDPRDESKQTYIMLSVAGDDGRITQDSLWVTHPQAGAVLRGLLRWKELTEGYGSAIPLVAEAVGWARIVSEDEHGR